MLDELLLTSINIRLEKARECLIDAERNLTDNAYANAANRSYYCIFHSIRATLITIGFSSKTHSGNISEFRRKFIKTGIFPVEFSNIIGKAFEVRNDSDYDDFYIISKDEVTKQTQNARVFLAAIEKYINSIK